MKKSGFSLVEVAIGFGLATIFLSLVAVVVISALSSSSRGENFSKAYRSAQEGMEAVIYLKSQNDSLWNWSSSPVNTLPGEYYQPAQVEGVWQLGAKTKTPSLTKAPFTRKVEINSVCRRPPPNPTIIRCDEIGASVDYNSRQVVVYVSWPERGKMQEVRLDAYVTAH